MLFTPEASRKMKGIFKDDRSKVKNNIKPFLLYYQPNVVSLDIAMRIAGVPDNAIPNAALSPWTGLQLHCTW